MLRLPSHTFHTSLRIACMTDQRTVILHVLVGSKVVEMRARHTLRIHTPSKRVSTWNLVIVFAGWLLLQ